MKIGIGTAQLGLKYGIANPNLSSSISKNDFSKILNLSLKKKIKILDTAESYGNSEKLIGSLLLKKKFKNQFNIITKLSDLRFINSKNIYREIYEKINISLNNLKIKKIYGLLIHDIKDLKSKKKDVIFRSLLRLKKEGLVKKIGFSCYKHDDLTYFSSKYNFDIIQFPFNILDQRLLETKTLKNLKKNKVEIHIRSIFLQGLLLLPQKKIPYNFLKNHNSLKKWHKFLRINNIDPISACLNFIIKNNFYKNVIIGFNEYFHFKDVINKYSFIKKKKLDLNYNKLKNFNENIINPNKWKKLK